MLALGLACLLPGCKAVSSAAGPTPQLAPPEWKTLSLRTDNDANANSPVALDIVFVRDAALLDTLAAMPASKWFAGRADMVRGFAGALTVWSLELLPGQSTEVEDRVWRSVAAWGVLAFADYASPGEHRLRLALDARGYLIRLGAEDVAAIEVNH